MEGRKEEREGGVTWLMEAGGGGGGGGWGVSKRETEQRRERPLKEVRASRSLKWREVEGGSGSRLGRLRSTAQH